MMNTYRFHIHAHNLDTQTVMCQHQNDIVSATISISAKSTQLETINYHSCFDNRKFYYFAIWDCFWFVYMGSIACWIACARKTIVPMISVDLVGHLFFLLVCSFILVLVRRFSYNSFYFCSLLSCRVLCGPNRIIDRNRCSKWNHFKIVGKEFHWFSIDLIRWPINIFPMLFVAFEYHIMFQTYYRRSKIKTQYNLHKFGRID